MKKSKLNDMQGGWFVGDFEPSVFRTKEFEVGFKRFKQGEYVKPHVHKLTQEINLMVRGTMAINGRVMGPGDIFILEAGETVFPTYLTDCEIVIARQPSIPSDKIEVNDVT